MQVKSCIENAHATTSPTPTTNPHQIRMNQVVHNHHVQHRAGAQPRQLRVVRRAGAPAHTAEGGRGGWALSAWRGGTGLVSSSAVPWLNPALRNPHTLPPPSRT